MTRAHNRITRFAALFAVATFIVGCGGGGALGRLRNGTLTGAAVLLP